MVSIRNLKTEKWIKINSYYFFLGNWHWLPAPDLGTKWFETHFSFFYRKRTQRINDYSYLQITLYTSPLPFALVLAQISRPGNLILPAILRTKQLSFSFKSDCQYQSVTWLQNIIQENERAYLILESVKQKLYNIQAITECIPKYSSLTSQRFNINTSNTAIEKLII